jgi:hypothetical protein
MGLVRLTHAHCEERRFDSRSAVFHLLRKGQGATIPAPPRRRSPMRISCHPEAVLRFSIAWHPVAPLAVYPASSSGAPLGDGGNGTAGTTAAVLLPGMVVQAELRRRAEYILRSVLSPTTCQGLLPARRMAENIISRTPLSQDISRMTSLSEEQISGKDPKHTIQELLNQKSLSYQTLAEDTECDVATDPRISSARAAVCGASVLDAVFGNSDTTRVGSESVSDNGDQRRQPAPAVAANGSRSALVVADCYGRKQASLSALWGHSGLSSLPRCPLEPIPARSMVASVGVPPESAIHSRVNGQEIVGPLEVHWEPLVWDLYLHRLLLYDATCLMPVIALLLLVIRDAAAASVPVRQSPRFRWSSISIDKVTLTGYTLPRRLRDLENRELSFGQLQDLPATIRDQLTESWLLWIRSKIKTAQQ